MNKLSNKYLLLPIIMVLTVFAGSTGCYLKTTERNTSLEEAKQNSQQREVPFNERASDQMISPGGKIPFFEDAKMGTTPNGINFIIVPNKIDPDRMELELIMRIPGQMDHFDTEMYKVLAKAMLLKGMYDDKAKSYRALQEFGIFTSFKGVISIEDEFIRFNFNASSKNINQLFDWLVSLTEFQKIPDHFFVDALDWHRAESINRSRYNGAIKPGMLLSMEDKSRDNSVPIEKFMDRWKNIVKNLEFKILIVGDVEPAMVKQDLIQSFSVLPGKTTGIEEAGSQAGKSSGLKINEFKDLNKEVHRVEFIYEIPAIEYADQNDLKNYVKRLMAYLALSDRMNQLDLSGLPLQKIEVKYEHHLNQLDRISIEGWADEASIPDLIERVGVAVQDLRINGIPNNDWEYFGKLLIRQKKSDLRNIDTQTNNSILRDARQHIIFGIPLLDPSKWYSYLRVTVPQINPLHLNQLLSANLTEGNRTIVINYYGKPGDQFESKISRKIKNGFTSDGKQPAIQKGNFGLNQTDFSTLERVTLRDRFNSEYGRIEMVKFENGMELILNKNSALKDEIQFLAVAAGGLKDLDKEKTEQFIGLQTYINYLNSLNSIELGDVIFTNGSLMEFEPYLSQASHGFAGKCTPEDIEPFMQLVYDYFSSSQITEQYNTLADRNELLILGEGKKEAKFGCYPSQEFEEGNLRIFRTENIDTGVVAKNDLNWIRNASQYTFIVSGNYNSLALIARAQKYLGSISVPKSATSDNVTNNDLSKLGSNLQDGHLDKKGTILFRTDFDWTSKELVGLYSLAKYLELKLEKEQLLNKNWMYNYLIEPARFLDGKPYGMLIYFCDQEGQTGYDFKTNLSVIIEQIQTGNIDKQVFIYMKEQLSKALSADFNSNRFWLDQIKGSMNSGKVSGLPDFENFLSQVDLLDENTMQLYATLYLTENNRVEHN